MKISVVIATYNKLPRLKLTLLTLLHQTFPKENFEVIIIDDGSNDGTGEYLKQNNFSLNYKYARFSNSGRSAARNRGIKLSNHDIILFIDDDVLLPPDFIEKHGKLQEAENRVVHGRIINLTYLKFFQDPTNGILYPQFSKMDKGISQLQTKCISERDIVENFEKIKNNNKKINNLEHVIETIFKLNKRDVFWLAFTGGNVSVPKEWVLKAGMFDTGFGLNWGSEDLELGYKLCKLGYKFFYSYEAVNYHMAHYRHSFSTDHEYTSQYFRSKYKDINIYYLQEFIAGRINSHEFIMLVTNNDRA